MVYKIYMILDASTFNILGNALTFNVLYIYQFLLGSQKKLFYYMIDDFVLL